MIDYDRLEREADALARRYQAASPYPHITLDNFLLPDAAAAAAARFPTLAAMDALRDMRQSKAQDPKLDKFDAVFKDIIEGHLNAPRFIGFIGKLTGISGLKPDPRLYAAGLAQGGNGSFLNVHIDNSSHPVEPWYRRVNILVYLNPRWDESKGGAFEVWDEAMTAPKAYLPLHNRALIFTVSPTSWHGYTKVVTPDGDTRKSINIYYFSDASPTGEAYHHVTTFRARPGETKNRLLYPVDNAMRTLYRKARRKKDAHAVLYDENGTPGDPKKADSE